MRGAHGDVRGVGEDAVGSVLGRIPGSGAMHWIVIACYIMHTYPPKWYVAHTQTHINNRIILNYI